MAYVEFSLGFASALLEIADSAFCVGLVSEFGVKVPWFLCISGGMEYVVCGGILAACALTLEWLAVKPRCAAAAV